MSNLSWLLFSFSGRINRATYAMLTLGTFAFVGVTEYALAAHYLHFGVDASHKMTVTGHMPPAVGIALFVLAAVSYWIAFAANARRLHDFNMSGWWQLAPAGVNFVGAFCGGLFAGLGMKAVGGVIAVVLVLIGGIGGLVLLGMLFFRAGTDGENSFPRGPSSQGGDGAPRRLATAAASPRADESLLTVYRAPQSRPAGFGRRNAA